MNLYLDTSALVKLYVLEAGSEVVADRVARAPLVATSRVAYPEARAALARRQREGALTAADVGRAVRDLRRDLDAFVVVELTPPVAFRAGDLAEAHALRGLDGIHLASALELGQLTGSLPAFLAFDSRLGAAAAAERLPAA